MREALIAQLLGRRILLERYGQRSASEIKATADWESGKTDPEMVNDYDPVAEGSSVAYGYY